MTMRSMMLGVVAAVAVCGMAAAKPPAGALSEGRELDPVARDFQLIEPPVTVESTTPSRTAEKPGDVFGWALFVALTDALMYEFTIPLGTVQPTDGGR